MTEVEMMSLISKPWQKFFNRFAEIDSLPVEEWKELHLLAYFCRRYENFIGHKFAFTFKNSPSKCTEIFFIKKIMAMLLSNNMKFIKEYIDWIFDTKIIPNNIKLRTLGYLSTAGFGNEFLTYKSKKEKIVKSTFLPEEYKKLANDLNISVNTYGDLAFIKMAIDKSPNSQSRQPYKVFFDHIINLGFKPSVLENLR